MTYKKRTWVNGEVIDADKLNNIEDGISEARKAAEDSSMAALSAVPIGATLIWAGSANSTPAGYLICDGRTVSRTEYAALYTVIGTTFGAGDGRTTFAVPDLRDRFVVGAGGKYNRGATGGEADHELTVEEMPAHTHSVNEGGEHTHSFNDIIAVEKGQYLNSSSGSIPGYNDDARVSSLEITSEGSGHSHSVESTGGSKAHNNMPPYLAMAYIIRAK